MSDTGSFAPLPSSAEPEEVVSSESPAEPSPRRGSSGELPRLASSETVINSGQPQNPLVEKPAADGESASMMQRLFPPPSETGSTFSRLSPAGIELDHFRIEERIGFGGMGAVFKAVDTRLQRHVALKLLAPSQSYDEASVKRFQNEARAAARLDHENVARVYYIGEERGLHFIAFEYVTGSNIRDMIRAEGRLAPVDAVNYALQIAYALKHTSAMGVVHRDIKPSNVIITPTGRAKLVDLGLARKDNAESQGDLTLPGTTLGTFDYISPEQAKDPRSVDVRSDIYSLGCTMYHMLTGQPPYPEGTVLQKLLDHQGKEAPDPAAINPRVPEPLSNLVRKMMNSDRNQRYQTPELLIRDLSYVAATLGLRGVNPEGLVWVASKAVQPSGLSSHTGWIATVAILFGVVGLLSAFPQLGSESVSFVEHEGTSALAEPDRDSEPMQPGPAVAAADGGAGPLEAASDSSAAGTPGDAVPIKPQQEPAGRGEEAENRSPTETAVASATNDAKPVVSSPGDAPANGSTEPAESTNVASPPAPTDDATTPGTASVAVDEYPVTLFSSDSQVEESYRTLESACAAAADGSTIELRYSGPIAERSFRIARKNITIRAARGFRPVVVFEPTDLDSTDAAVRMISVAGSPLHIINVDFQLLIPEDAAADRYALFGMTRQDALQLDQVTVTVVNPQQRPTALIDVAPDPSQMPPDPSAMPVTATRSPSAIDLRNCFVRGELSLARLAVTGQLELSIENSAIAVDDLLYILPIGSSMSDRPSISVSLDHVSALLHGSLVRFFGPVSVNGPTIELQPRNCVVTAAPETPLVTAEADVPADELRRMFVWRGQRNFYDRLETYMAIQSADEVYGFEEWRQYWGTSLEVGPWSGTLNWDGASRPPGTLDDLFSDLSLNAFQLRLPADGENPAIAGATDGNDAGADLSLIPQPWQPEPDSAEPPANEASASASTSSRSDSD
ncbi:MAG: serine/threonine-protein kinase [Planctomycetota bacterium]